MESLIETLRQKETGGQPLTEQEQEVLSRYYATWEGKEQTALAPALSALREQKKRQTETIHRLEALYQAKKQCLQHIQSLIVEIESIEREETRLLSAVKG